MHLLDAAVCISSARRKKRGIDSETGRSASRAQCYRGERAGSSSAALPLLLERMARVGSGIAGLEVEGFNGARGRRVQGKKRQTNDGVRREAKKS